MLEKDGKAASPGCQGSLSITGQMQADGRVTLKGVHTPDEAIPFTEYVEELGRRGIRIEEL